jgi:hypothetical protein
MHRIDAADHADNLFSEGNPATGTPGTKVSAEWLNAVQEELCNALAAAGVAPNKGSNSQLADALVTREELTFAVGSYFSKSADFFYVPIPLRIFRIGKTVFLQGAVKCVQDFNQATVTIATLPAGWRPDVAVPVPFTAMRSAGTTAALAIVQVNGSITYFGSGSYDEIGGSGDGFNFCASFTIP